MANNASPTPIPLILTRPEPASKAFFDSLDTGTRQRVRPIISPLIDIVALDVPLSIAPQEGVIFTSANAVRLAPPGNGRRAFCVGAATTDAARHNGWTAQQSGTDAKTLVSQLIAAPPAQPLIHLSGRHTRGDIAEHLQRAGLVVRNIAIYDQHLRPLAQPAADAILQNDRVIVPLFSPRTAAQFASAVPRPISCHIISLSQAVADTLGTADWGELTIVRDPTAQAMGAALAKVVRDV